ncbi:MAG: Lrp/AsnC family transcriptional regulator [Chloroflexota bacterium]
MRLDDTDWAILRELQEDARLSYAEIGRRVGLSSPAVQERVRRMEDATVIKAYRADINYEAVGLPIMSLTRLMNVQGTDNINKVKSIAQSIPQVIRCYHVMGQDEYVFQIVATSVGDLEDILHKFTDYGHLVSAIVINTPVDHSTIDLDTLPSLKDKHL